MSKLRKTWKDDYLGLGGEVKPSGFILYTSLLFILLQESCIFKLNIKRELGGKKGKISAIKTKSPVNFNKYLKFSLYELNISSVTFPENPTLCQALYVLAL